MELITRIVETCLVALFEKSVIDWLPDEDAPETFVTECEIEIWEGATPSLIGAMVTICDWFVFLWAVPDGWEVFHAMSCAIVTCPGCQAKYAQNEMRSVAGRKLCEHCAWQRKRLNPSLVLLADIIRACLTELGDRGVLDWFPGDNEPESFYAECEIDRTDPRLPMEVRMCDYVFWLWERNGTMEVYYSLPQEKVYA